MSLPSWAARLKKVLDTTLEKLLPSNKSESIAQELTPREARDYILAQTMIAFRDPVLARRRTYEVLEGLVGTPAAATLMLELVPSRGPLDDEIPPLVVINEPRR